MRRLTALVLACVLTVPSAAVPLLHVHAYVDHDHPEHHHGPAAHGHNHSTLIHRDVTPSVKMPIERR